MNVSFFKSLQNFHFRAAHIASGFSWTYGKAMMIINLLKIQRMEEQRFKTIASFKPAH